MESYLRDVRDVARWSEAAGFCGILVYTDNGLVDAWLVAQIVIQSTERLAPLVALQPVYMHPYTAAKLVSSLAFLHGRQVFLNLVAGGFKNDLEALGDSTAHDDRYERLIEYTLVVKALLSGGAPVTFEGRFYNVRNLRMAPALPPELFPGLLMSGSSEAGLCAAARVGATPIKYPKPPGEETSAETIGSAAGIRVGIIARPDSREAWRVAHERFPEDRRGAMTHQLAMRVSDSSWHHQLSAMAGAAAEEEESPYWLGPFQHYQTFCPYLVGSYERVGFELARYVGLGHRTFILDIPPSSEELEHTRVAFAAARGDGM